MFRCARGRGITSRRHRKMERAVETVMCRSAGVSPALWFLMSGSIVTTVRNRGRLPHRENKHAVYFVTFRLADSLPKTVLQQIEWERRDIVSTAPAMHRDLSPNEQKRLAALFTDRVETYLDAASGSCNLAKRPIANSVVQALRHFDDVRYRIFAWRIMPNHVHVIFQPLEANALAGILHSWKSYTAKEANRLLKRTGSFWQREYYDHLVRDEEDFGRIVRYVLENPRRAGLHD
jgi:REP element-mobilizing transposase RayT